MTVFFAATLSSESYEVSVSQKIIEALRSMGHEILVDLELNPATGEIQMGDEKNELNLDKIESKMKRADAFFAKASLPSTVIGYLINMALQAGKPVILFTPTANKQVFFRALENENDKLQVIEYRENEPIGKEVSLAIEYVNSSQDTRFNFFVSPDISTYLNWVSRSRRIPRSVYLRELIDNDMKRSGNN